MRRVLVLLAVPLLTVALTSAPAQAGPTSTLVVNTVLGQEVSPVVEATGSFAGCDEVVQGRQRENFGPEFATFRGNKTVQCPGGTLTLRYKAVFTYAANTAKGTWRVLEGTGTFEGATGGGKLKGDPTSCEIPPGAGGCILDTFTGRVN